MTNRRFPPRWSVQELEACFFVTDSAGQKLAYVYYYDEPQRRAAAKLLTKDEARRTAASQPDASPTLKHNVREPTYVPGVKYGIKGTRMGCPTCHKRNLFMMGSPSFGGLSGGSSWGELVKTLENNTKFAKSCRPSSRR